MAISSKGRWSILAGSVTAAALVLTGCTAGGGAGDGGTTLTWLVDNTETAVANAEQLAEDFNAANPDIKVEIETRPQGGDGDNIVKTKLATGEMADLFSYPSGSLFRQINPAQNLVPITNEPYLENVSDSFKPVVSAENDIFGVPVGTGNAGGVLYNRKVYSDLGLSVPKSWDEFMANNRKIKDAGIDPIIQTYQTTWTSQLFVLGDFANVASENPAFAEEYTANKAKYSTDPAAVKGFEHLQEVAEAKFFNEDFASASYAQGLEKLVNGEGAQYPILSFALPEIKKTFPDQLDNIGLFPIPGEDAAKNSLTIWLPGGVYIPKSTENLEEAKKFQAFLASTAACDSQTKAVGANGPYLVKGCDLPQDVAPAVADMLPFFEDEAKNSPALEYLSPVKGPALEKITVEVGSGLRSAKDGAALYDEDVKKQAKQLNLPGWN